MNTKNTMLALVVGLSAAAGCVGAPSMADDVGADDAGIDTLVVDQFVAPDTYTIDAPVDVLEAGPACDLSKPFGKPVPLVATAGVSEEQLWPSSDLMTGYFDRPMTGGVGGYDLVTISPIASSGTVQLIANVNSAQQDRNPVLSDNGLDLYFTSNRPGVGAYDIYVATRPTVLGAFQAPTALAAPINTTSNDYTNWINDDETTIYFQSDRPGGQGASDILIGHRADTKSPFTVSFAVALSSSGDDCVALTSDELQAFVSSSRSGGPGNLDIYYAKRSTKADGFSTPTLVSELSGPTLDEVQWVSPDGCTVYITRSESSAAMYSYDIYTATRGK